MSTALVHDVDRAILDAVEDHAFSETSREVGGVFVGTFDDRGARVSAALPALRAVGSSAQVTFTHEVWDDVLSAIERDHPGERIIGWYHSHPGFGIFLSEYDLFLHRSFFSDPRMLALVVDPLAGQSGWFGWQDEEIVELITQPTRRSGLKTAAAASGGGASARRGVGGAAVLATLGIATLTFGVGYAVAPGGSTGKTQQLQYERDAAVRDRDALLAQQPATSSAQSAPAPLPPGSARVRYRVRQGDTLSSLALAFYGNAAAVPQLATANHISDPRSLRVGDVLVVKAAP